MLLGSPVALLVGMSDLPNSRPSLAESATAENTEGGVGQHPGRAQETEGMKCWNVRLSKPNDLTADSSRGTCTTRWVRWLLQPGREPQPVTVIVNVMLGNSNQAVASLPPLRREPIPGDALHGFRNVCPSDALRNHDSFKRFLNFIACLCCIST